MQPKIYQELVGIQKEHLTASVLAFWLQTDLFDINLALQIKL